MKKRKINKYKVISLVSIILLISTYLYGQSLTREINLLEREIISLKQNGSSERE